MLKTELIATIHKLLAEQQRVRPDRIAYIDDRRAITFGELSKNTARIAGHLQRLGVTPGDRVMLYLDNCVEVAESYLAIPRAGAVAVCANPQSAPAEASHILTDSGSCIVITDEPHLITARSIATETATVRAIVVVDTEGADLGRGSIPEVRYTTLLTPSEGEPRDSLSLDDTAWILYTSGTTGRPKGVRLTQRGCFWVVASCWAGVVGLRQDDVILSPLPLFHSYALNLCVLVPIAVGVSVRILPKFSVNDLPDRFAGGTEGDITIFPGVPTMFHYLLERRRHTGLSAPGLRLCISAGAIMPAALNQAFEEAFGVGLLDGYGITETSTMVTMNWPTGRRIMGSCGLPLPGLTVRLVDTVAGRDARQGEEGEIWVQGPNVTPGYHNLPEASAAVLVEGWYHTGDLGRRDEYGYISICGRTKELIIRGGENIYPAEVEDALMACGAFEDVAVVGVPHSHLGEVPVAFVVPREPAGQDHTDVLAFLDTRLSSFKVPERFIEIDEIPRTGSGKIMRVRLRERLIDEGLGDEDREAARLTSSDQTAVR